MVAHAERSVPLSLLVNSSSKRSCWMPHLLSKGCTETILGPRYVAKEYLTGALLTILMTHSEINYNQKRTMFFSLNLRNESKGQNFYHALSNDATSINNSAIECRLMTASVFKPEILQGKVALITGGGTGIGFEIAREFGLHGACVCILGRRTEVLEEAVSVLRKSGINATKAVADVRNETECSAALTHTLKVFGGSLDILVNAAAGNFLAKAEDLTLKGFKTVMEIDAYGVFNMCRLCFSHLRASRGTILNISMTLHIGASWFQLHASAAKSAIDSMTRTLALEWGQYGIRVNGVAPGPIADTAGMSKLAPTAEHALESGIRRTVPLGRFGTKTEIAMTCIFLVSSAASYISGCTVIADGGHWLYKSPPINPSKVSKTSRSLEKTTKDIGRPMNSKL